jgi:mannose-6-phosphate isomerase-like protein (cupin superfamily)
MAKIIEMTGGYQPEKPPTIPKPDKPIDPSIVTAQDGVPVIYPSCKGGLGVRIVHPVNPKAPGKNLGLVLFYLPPHAILSPGSHETEETYVILEGRGQMTFANFQRDVKKGDFVYLRPWCLHGIENTGTDVLVVLIATSPPNP